MDKEEVTERYGAEQVSEWRRSANVRPPAVSREAHLKDLNDPKYAGLNAKQVPLTESLLDTEERVLVYWRDKVIQDLEQNHCVIISAHGNTLRALVKYLDQIPDDGVVSLNIPNSIPLVYELDDQLKPIRHYYLNLKGEITDGSIPKHFDLDDPNNHNWIG